MKKQTYDFILNEYYGGKIDWQDIATRFGFPSKHSARAKFRRERIKKGDATRDEYLSGSDAESSEKTTYRETDDSLHIVCDSKRLMSRDDIVEHFGIDLNIWKIKEFTVKTSEGYRKDRSVEWKVSQGVVTSGEVHDSGKLLIAPMYHTETKFVRKTLDDFWAKKDLDSLFEKMSERSFSPVKVKSLQYKKNGKALIVPIGDFHLGLLATMQANNNEYNMEIAENLFMETLGKIKEKVSGSYFEEVVFVVGNDFLNSDNLSNTTTRGTPQDSDTFWYEIIDKAVELISVAVNSLLEISKVRVYNVVSNHDHHSMYGIMKTVDAIFKDNKNVFVDTSPLPRKYYKFGKSIVGLTHDMKVTKGLETITTEQKEHWSDCEHFYFILAHLHTAMQYERKGLLETYRVPTFSGYSRWSNDKAFINTQKRTQCFVLDENFGIEDTMNINV